MEVPWGAKFYMMEDMTTGTAKPLLVMIENIKLRVPLPIDYIRRTGTGTRVGPTGKKLAGEFADNLLKDALEANPGLRTRLRTYPSIATTFLQQMIAAARQTRAS